MSLLASQLAKINDNNPNKLIYASKNKVSLVFDDPTDCDVDSAFAVGMNGLMGLEAVDKAFSVFKGTLFSVKAKEWNRSTMVRAVLTYQ